MYVRFMVKKAKQYFLDRLRNSGSAYYYSLTELPVENRVRSSSNGTTKEICPMKASRLLALTILLFTFSALDARAQNPQPTPTPNRTRIIRRDDILINPNDKIGSADRYSIIPPNTITGKIRWRREYGLPYNNSNDGRPVHPYPCGTGPFYFRSTMLVIRERPGQTPQGTYQDVGSLTGEPNLSDAGIANVGG